MALRRDPLPRVVRRTLTKREKIIVSVHRHWAWLVAPVAILLAATLFALWFAVSFPDTGPLPTLIWLGWLAVVLRTGWYWFQWWRQCFIVTSERIILVHGGFTVEQTQLPLAFGKDITLRQNLIGQWLGFGDFILETAPKDHALHEVRWLPDCERLHRRMTRLMQGDEGRQETVPDVIPTYDDKIVIIDESSRNEPQRVHRTAGSATVQPLTRGPGLLSLWRGVRSTMPVRPQTEQPKRRVPLRRKPRRPSPGRAPERVVTTTGKEPQPQNVLRRL